MRRRRRLSRLIEELAELEHPPDRGQTGHLGRPTGAVGHDQNSSLGLCVPSRPPTARGTRSSRSLTFGIPAVRAILNRLVLSHNSHASGETRCCSVILSDRQPAKILSKIAQLLSILVPETDSKSRGVHSPWVRFPPAAPNARKFHDSAHRAADPSHRNCRLIPF